VVSGVQFEMVCGRGTMEIFGKAEMQHANVRSISVGWGAGERRDFEQRRRKGAKVGAKH